MDVRLVVVPYDSGVHRARMGRGPERLAESCLEPLVTRLGHTVHVDIVRTSDQHPAEIASTFELCRSVAGLVHESCSTNAFPVLLSGNCNIAVGAVAGCGADRTGVVWFDAHGESTTPDTTTSGFLDGMGISILLGQCWRTLANRIPRFVPVRPEHVVLIGARDVEADEAALLDRLGVRRIAQLAEIGPAVDALSRTVDGVYVHLDLDVLDPLTAIANQWTSPGGLTPDALVDALTQIGTRTRIKGFGIASYDPECDRNRHALQAAGRAAEAILGRVE